MTSAYDIISRHLGVSGLKATRYGRSPFAMEVERVLAEEVERIDAARMPAPKPTPAPQPVAPAPSSPAGLGVVRSNDHRLGDFSGSLS